MLNGEPCLTDGQHDAVCETPRTSRTNRKSTLQRQLFPVQNVLQAIPEEDDDEVQILPSGTLDMDNLPWEEMDPDIFRKTKLDELFNIALIHALYRMYNTVKMDSCIGCKHNKGLQKHNTCLLECVPMKINNHTA